jgi:hypothetical protein
LCAMIALSRRRYWQYGFMVISSWVPFAIPWTFPSRTLRTWYSVFLTKETEIRWNLLLTVIPKVSDYLINSSRTRAVALASFSQMRTFGD